MDNEYKKTKDNLFIQFKEEILKNKNLTVNNIKNIEYWWIFIKNSNR